MKFLAIDFETANPDLASICQIGVVVFQNGSVSKTWQSLVDPEDYFDGMCVAVHGITEDDVKGALTFPKLYSDLRTLLEKQIVVSHTSFDRVALGRVLEKYGVTGFDCTWLDSARTARRAWSELASKGYGLWNVARVLGIDFQHHVAQQDARAAGEIVLRVMKDTGKNLEELLVRVNQPISIHLIAQEGNPEGPLYGEGVVFTGAQSLPRREAATLAGSAGCNVATTVNKSSTLIVAGDYDIRRMGSQETSSKHRKAEEYTRKVKPIRILGESNFRLLVGLGK